ncbi:MAG: twin-arginine translocase subunit TatC [Myxococcota bacterium]
MDDSELPLTEHLSELRRRLFFALGTWLVCSGAFGYWAPDVYQVLMGPAVSAILAKGHTLVSLSPPEIFFTYVKSVLLAGFLTSLPMTLYQSWAFVAPGLYAGEKRMAAPFVLATTGLFLGGAAFGYFVAFPFVFDYFLSLEASYVTTSWSMQNTFAFMWRLYLAFGLAFQLPVVIFFLSLAGIVTPRQLARGRIYAIPVLFFVGAVLTPPDVVSQVMLALPMILLYELGVAVSAWVVRRRMRRIAKAHSEILNSD